MKRQLRALGLFLALAFVASHLAVAGDKSPQSRLPVPRIEDLPSTRIDWAYDQTRLTALSDRTKRASLAGVDVYARAAVPHATLTDALYLNPALLNLPSDRPVLGTSTSVPRQIAHLQLTIGTEQFVLFVGDVTYDSAKEIRHVTAAVLSHANSYARFAVQDRTGMISGTIRTPQHTYRIVPYREGGQLAYRLGDTAGGVPARYRGVLTPTTGNPAALAVEDRHRMAELLADIQPWHVNFSKNEFMLTLVGGNIGRLDPDSVSPTDIRDLLTRLSPLTKALGKESFEIISVTPRDDEAPGARAIEFRQVVNGIQINFDQEIIVDANGRIRQLLVGLVSPETIPARSIMTETDAWATAAQQLRDALAGDAVKQDGADVELRYDRVGGQWTPVWRFAAVVSGRGSYFIDIDAGSGRARWWSADRRITGDDFRTAIFRTTSGTPDDRADAGATLVCQEGNDADIGCDGELDRYLWPERISQKLNFDWETARGNDPYLCCMGVGAPSSAQGPPFQDEFLDIIIDTPAAMEGGWSPRYRATTATLLIPPQVPGYQYDYSKSADVIVHEHMHAYIHRANPSFHNHPADNSGALNEGIADGMTGMFATKAQQGWEEAWLGPGNPATGAAWVIGDSPVAPFPANLPDERRDLTDAAIDWSWFEVNSPHHHRRGKAIGAFYYRLWTKHAVTDTRMVEFMLRVVKVIRDPDFDGYDLDDFYNALIDSVKAGESALISAINDAWDEMSPATPPPGTPPLPPPYVAGLPYGCVSGYSTYTISWPAVNNADDYNVYASAGFGYDYLGSTPQTFGYFWTSVNSDVRVSASNTYGESGLSPVGFSASHSLCF